MMRTSIREAARSSTIPRSSDRSSKPYETPKSTGRYGISGWMSPTTPIGAAATGWPESNGVFAFGFSMTWDGPPPARRPAPNPKP